VARLPRTSYGASAGGSEEMAPVDALLLHGDTDPRRRSSLIGLCLLERAPHWPDLVASVDRATRTVPRLRQRVVSPLLPISRPYWVADPDFDLSYHLRHVRVPEPGGFAELLTLTEVAEMAPLDLARPLWEMTLVEGLRIPGSTEERAALLWKFSHALGDGVGVLQIAVAMFDLEAAPPGPDPAEVLAAPPLQAPQGKSRLGLLRDRVVDLPIDLATDAVRTGLWAASTGLRVAADPKGAAGGAVEFARSLGRLVTPPDATSSPAMRSRGTKRRLLVHEVPLEELKQAGRAGGGSVNDAYLAGVLGGMRLYHEAVGVPVDRLPMAVPVYGRPGGATGLAAAVTAPGGNHFSAVRFAAPVGETDPVVRMQQVRDLVTAGRNEAGLGATDALARVFARTPQVLLAEIARQQGHLDLQASNVAGFPGQVYLAGVPVDGMFSFGPAPGVAVMFVLVSYNGTCNIGVTLDEAAIIDPELFSRCIAAGFDEVLLLADPTRADLREAAGNSESA
jgi:diacylglycerol O-acyltransferase